MYLRIWEYEVPPETVDEFITAYGARGEWARLFARTDGYGGTELFRHADRLTGFLTIDRWRDEAAWNAFREHWREAYQVLDRRLARLTAVELPLFEGTIPAPTAALRRSSGVDGPDTSR